MQNKFSVSFIKPRFFTKCTKKTRNTLYIENHTTKIKKCNLTLDYA